MDTKLIKRLEAYHCPNSTDAQGEAANHYVREGACVICDRTPFTLAYLHGLLPNN